MLGSCLALACITTLHITPRHTATIIIIIIHHITSHPRNRAAVCVQGDFAIRRLTAHIAWTQTSMIGTGVPAKRRRTTKAEEGAAADWLAPSPIIQTPRDLLALPLTEFIHHIAESGNYEEQHVANWVQHNKTVVNAKLIKFLRRRHAQVSFLIPADVLDFEPLAITAAASGAILSGFREVMHYTHLLRSLEKSAMYEAAGTIWMLDPVIDPGGDRISINQLENAMPLWSEEAYQSSSSLPLSRRYSFDVPLPAKVVDSKVAQKVVDSKVAQKVVDSKIAKVAQNKDAVAFAKPVPLLAGLAIVITWYGAMREALERAASSAGEEGVLHCERRVFKLFEAALSVPIRLHLNPDSDRCRLISLRFSEQLYSVAGAAGADSFWKFAQNVSRLTLFQKTDDLSLPKALAALKKHGLTFKGKGFTENLVKAVRVVAPFAEDARCSAAFARLVCVSPEFRELTLIQRVASLTTKKSQINADQPQTDAAKDKFVFILDSLRVGRLAGDMKKDDVYTVSMVTGQHLKTPALVHKLFKKQDLVEHVYQQAWLINHSLAVAVRAFRTPHGIWQEFQTPLGEQKLIAAIRKGDLAPGKGLESEFRVKVAEYRDQTQHDVKVRALIDLLWGVWCDTFDAEFMELCSHEMNASAPNDWTWHRYLTETPHFSAKGLGPTYRRFTAACTEAPLPAAPGAELVTGTSHLQDADKEDHQRVSEALNTMRRKTVSFVPLPTIGGAVGADFSKAQLDKVWEGMRLGYKFQRNRRAVRAFVLSSELFPPNVAKHSGAASLTQPIACDAERMKRVIEFIANKRSKDDLVILFDGRSRQCRKVMEAAEGKLAASGVHEIKEIWFVYVQPRKHEDARAPGKQVSFNNNNREIAIVASPGCRSRVKLVQRSEFNVCGEDATSATTYTGVPMRRLNELPRMEYDCKANILGAAAASPPEAGSVGKRINQNIQEKGHPFSQCEVKPLNLWQRICEHHGVTHIVDFSPGSGGLAIAAAGAVEYEGVATNEMHCSWLDSTLDLVVKYLASTDKEFSKKLGGDDEFAEKVVQYFAGTLMEARRYLEPEVHSDEDNEDDGESSEDGD